MKGTCGGPVLERALPLAPDCQCAEGGRHVIAERQTALGRWDAYAVGCKPLAHGDQIQGQGCAPSGRDLYCAPCCSPCITTHR